MTTYPRRTIALGPPYDDGTYWEDGQMKRLPKRDERLTVSDISESLWVEMNAYGVRMEVDEQVAIARSIHQHSHPTPTSDAINRAFREIGLHAPRGLAIAVRGRLDRLHGGER
jgi:hypothetical protein